MKHLYIYLLPFFSFSQLYIEDFEDSSINYTTSTTEFTDGVDDFFTRTNGDNISNNYSVLNTAGDYYFAAQDIDGEGAASEQIITLNPIDVSDLKQINFSILIGEDDAADNTGDWDKSDYFKITYKFDSSDVENLLWIANNGDTFNSYALIDTNFDGIGDGTLITSEMTLYEKDITVPSLASNITFYLTFDLNGGDEDLAIDDILVTDISNTLSITNNNIKKEKFNIYPNPVTENTILITSKKEENIHLNIFNVAGQLVFNKITKTNEYTPIYELNPGVYLLSIESSSEKITKRILIK